MSESRIVYRNSFLPTTKLKQLLFIASAALIVNAEASLREDSREDFYILNHSFNDYVIQHNLMHSLRRGF